MLKKTLARSLSIGLVVSGSALPSLAQSVVPQGDQDATPPLAQDQTVHMAPEAFRELTPEQRLLVSTRRPPEAEPGERKPADALAGGQPGAPADDRARASASAAYETLPPFGSHLFAQANPAIGPVDDLPVPQDYRIGPGDEIAISAVSPSRSFDQTLMVGRDGTIGCPGVGSLPVAGMTFAQMVAYLGRNIRGAARNMRLSVRLGKLRSIKVFVAGHVMKPGVYTLSAFSSLSNAVLASGGPTTPGSMRAWQLKRSGRVVSQFDFYDLLLRGDNSKDVPLQSGDVVFVPAAGPMVEIAGSVKNPGTYELRGKTSLYRALALAGSVAPQGFTQRIQVERYDANRVRKVIDADLSRVPEESLFLQDGDRIRVGAVSPKLTNAVFLQGHVERPGRYEYRPELRVRDLIRSQDDLKPEAFLDFGLIERVVGPDSHLELMPFNLGKAMDGDPAENKLLAPQDTIRIYYRWEAQGPPTVRIAGPVNRPGEFRLRPGMTVAELVRLSGGLQDHADLSQAELTRQRVVDNKMVSRRVTVNLARALDGHLAANPVLEPGDHLQIKPVPNFQPIRTVTILGEVAQPGTYTFKDGESLGEILERAGGPTPRAYLKGAIFTRRSVEQQQEDRLRELIQKLEEDLYRNAAKTTSAALSPEAVNGTRESTAARKSLLESLKETKTAGRMILDTARLARKGRDGIQLEDGDSLVVPPTLDSVSVLGQVYNPTALIYEPGKTVEDYLSNTGGPTENADSHAIFVVKADGSVLTDRNTSGWRPFGKGIRGAVLDPGDTVMVPERMNADTALRDWRDVTQILFQIATTAAVTWGIVK